MKPATTFVFALVSATWMMLTPVGATEVILDKATAAIFPESWRGGKIQASAKPLLEDQAERLRLIIDRALAKYPQALLKATLVSIYGLGHLEYRGVATGGTRSARSIYVVCKPSYDDGAVERIIHAEYSSILFQKHAAQFDAEAWNRQNAEGVSYLGSGVAAVKAGKASSEMKHALNEQGFLTEYAQASIEEDFNSHVARLFVGDEAYWQALAKHPRLKAKAELVMAFYAKLNSEFSHAKFAALKPDESKLTLAGIFTEKKFEEEKMPAFQWSKVDSSYFTLDQPVKDKEGKELVRIDPATGKRTVIATTRELTPKGDKKPLSVADFQFSHDEKRLLIFTNTKKVWRKNTRGDYWLLDLATKKLQKLGGGAEASTLMFAKFSPDGSRVAHVRKNNLEVQNLGDLKITPLTSDGSETLINGTSDWVNEEELGLRDAFRWSPDGKRILFWQFDAKGVKTFSLINQTDGLYPGITTFPYPKAGEKNSATRLGIISADGGEVTWLKLPGDAREHYLPVAEWTPDGKSVLVQQFNRLQNKLTVFLVNPASGEAKKLLIETSETWVDNENTQMLWAKDGFLWLSERSGWRHAYHVGFGGQISAITKGAFDIIEIAKHNEKGQTLDFLASPQNATQRYLFRTSLNGGELQRLSPADQPGTHSYDISPDAKWAVHTFSNVNTPPVVSLVRLPKHETVRTLIEQKALKEKIAKLKMPKIDFIQVNIGEGLMADAWMMRNPDSDAKTKQPLLMNVYGEPAGQTVKDAWGGQKVLWHSMLAQQGFVIASVDTRGTPVPKGSAWRQAVYLKLGILNSQEQAAALLSLLKRFDFIDSKRVGIWGWSGGGSSSLDSLFRYPDLYSTAIAVAPVPDRHLYDSIYEERYMGLPKENAKGYTDGSPITHAGKLKGHLLIIHGTGDDNVHYQGVEKLINELVMLNKTFTVMPYPNRDHAINTGKGTSRHLYELMTRFLQTHLSQRPSE